MPPHIVAHECTQKENIELIKERLGDGDVSLALIKEQLDRIEGQTTRTNGRVSKLENFSNSLKWCVFGALGFALAETFGLLEVVKRVFS